MKEKLSPRMMQKNLTTKYLLFHHHITRLLFSSHFLREHFHRLPHRVISFKTHKPLGGQPQMPNWNPFFSPPHFMNERSSPDDGMSLPAEASLQMQGMLSGSQTDVLHNTPLQVQLIESGYEWQVAAFKWPSACEWGQGGAECIPGMTSEECCTLHETWS